MKRLRKLFFLLLILLLALAGLLYFVWQRAFEVPGTVMNRVKDYARGFHDIDFDAGEVRVNLPNHTIKASRVKVMLPGQMPFVEAEEAVIYLASGTGPLDLYFSRAVVEKVQITGLRIDATAPRPRRASDNSQIPRIPAREIIVNGLKLDTSVSIFNVPDFKARLIRTRRNANVEMSFDKSPLGGHARLIAMLGLNTGEARIKFNWHEGNFSGFIPLIFLSHRFGLNILSGGASVGLTYEGNLFDRITKPGENVATFLNKELSGSLSIDNCGFNWAGLAGKVDFKTERKPGTPWKYSLNTEIDKGRFSIAGTWAGRDDRLTDFSASVKGENLSLSKKAFEYLDINLLNTNPGKIDFSGEFVGDGKTVTGTGNARAHNWKYQNKAIHLADLKWSVDRDYGLNLDGSLKTEIGDLDASSTLWLGGLRKGQGIVAGDLEKIDLQKLRPFIESPVSGKCSGPFKVEFNFAHPASTTYDMRLEMIEGRFYHFQPEMLTARVYGTGSDWNLANPVAFFPDNGEIALDGLVTSKKFAAKASVKNIRLETFGVPQHIASGAVWLNASIGGPLFDPTVRGELWGQNLGLMKLGIESFRAQLLIQGTTLTLAPMVIKPGNEALLDGYFSVNLLDGSIKSFKLTFQKLPLAFIRPILPPHLAGSASEGVIAGHVGFNRQRAQNSWDFYLDGRKLLLADHEVDSLFLEGSVVGHQTDLKSLFVRAFGGSISISGQVLNTDQFSGAIEAESLHFEKMKFMKDLLPDLSGEFSAQGELDWNGTQRNGAFTVFARNMKTRDRELGNFGGEVEVNENNLIIKSGEFDKLGVKLAGDLAWAGRRAYKAELQLDKVDLSFIPEAHGINTFDYGGLLVSGKCQMQGDLASLTPDVVDLQVDSIRIQKENDVIVSNRPMQVIYQNNGVEIRSLELKYRQGILGIEGIFTPGRNVALMVNGSNFSVKALGRLFDLPNWNYDGSLSINARLFGDVDDIKLKATANVDELVVGGKKIPEVRAIIDGDRSGIDIADAFVKLPSSSFNLKGRVDMGENYVPDNINLHLFVPQGPITDLTEYLPNVFREASGTIKADLNLTGKPGSPEISGDLRLTADQLAFSSMRKPLTKVDFAISTDDRIINIDTLEANLGRGKVTGSGKINFRDSLGSITASISGQKIDLSFMNLELSNASATVDITGDLYNPILKGKVYVPRGKFNLTTDLLAKRKPVNFFFDSLNYHFDFEIPRNFWLKSSFLNSEMRGKFSVTGDLNNIKLDGGISCVQGKLYFKQRQFKIETGEVKFGGVDNSFDPQIFVKSEGQIQSTKVFLTLQGRVSSFTPQIYSTPPMAEGDLLALLTLGRDLNTAMHSDTKELFESEILEGLKNSYISALIGSTISTALNLDELFLSSLFDKTSGKSRSFIRVGKYIGQNIFMAYEGTMEQGQDESFIFEYRLPKGFVINIEFKEPVKEQRIGVRYDWKFW